MATRLVNRYFICHKEIASTLHCISCKARNNNTKQRVLIHCLRHKSGKSSTTKDSFSSIIRPLKVDPVTKTDDISIGEELTGTLKKGDF